MVSPKMAQPGRAQGRAGLDDVGDHVRDAELDARLDRSVEPRHRGVDPTLGQVGLDHTDVGRGDALALELVEALEPPDRSGEVEARAAEPELHRLDGLRTRVEEQVAAGDAGVERALADVQGDVARTQVEELDVVVDVDEGELLGVVALAIAGLAQDSVAAWDSAPCWVRRCGGSSRGYSVFSEVGVDVVEGQSAGEHQHLRVVEQLADLERGASLPSCSAAIQDSAASSSSFLPIAWTPASSCLRCRPLGPGRGLLAQLGPQLLERLHDRQA